MNYEFAVSSVTGNSWPFYELISDDEKIVATDPDTGSSVTVFYADDVLFSVAEVDGAAMYFDGTIPSPTEVVMFAKFYRDGRIGQ